MTEVAAPPVESILTAADRCDRCGAQAQVVVRLNAGELIFCAHHHREYAPALARAVAIPRSL